jgi:hypothetical protein
MTSSFKIATVQEKAMCLLWFFETKSVSKRNIVTEFNMEKIYLSDVG